MASFANVRFIKLGNLFGGANVILSVVIIAFYAFLIFLSFKKFIEIQNLRKKENLKKSMARVDEVENKLEKNNKIKEWYFLTEDLNPKLENYWKFIMLYQMIKEFLISFFVIVLISNPWFQLVPLIIMSSVMFIGILKYMPFEKKSDNVFTLIIEFLYVLLFIVLLWMQIGKESMSETQKYNLLGFSGIALIVIIILVHVVLGVMMSIISAKEMF
jgi:hypothetical protein